MAGITTATIPHAQPSRAPFVLLALALAAVLTITVAPRMHAVAKHGMEAVAVRRACDQYGPDQVWRSASWRDPDKYFRVCTLDDGRQGVQIIRCIKGVWHEVTAFIPAGSLGVGTPERVFEYLSGKATPWHGRLSSTCQ